MVSDDEPWPSNDAEALERVPDEWKEVDGRVKVVSTQVDPKAVPCPQLAGWESDIGTPVAFIRAPFKFCLSCGISYGGRSSSEFSKLGNTRVRRSQHRYHAVDHVGDPPPPGC